MMRWLMGWLWRVLVVLAVAFVVLYAGDWAVYKLRGSPRSRVTVNRYVTIPLKGNKQEFDYLGTIDVPCSASLFSQAGQPPCWQLRRNTNQGMNL
ncbi:MAG: hypothetical protein ABSC77_04175 [Terracidiphilus sp.]|jgi:hypothetical protein